MITRPRLIYLLAGMLPFSGSGCIVVGVGGWGWSCRGPNVWTESTTEQLPIDTASLKALEVRTHNGSISFDGQPPGAGEAYVIVAKKAGALTQAGAEEALQAIDVYVEPAGDDTQRIGWRWKGRKRPTWAAQVSFEIKAPGTLRFDGKSHNGGIEIEGVAGDVQVETHNGRVEVNSRDGKLHAETHNGRIVATYAGDDLALLTHNGRIVAGLGRCGAVNGTITTHNGGVEVTVGEDTSANLTCRTHNGSIECNVPLTDGEYSRRKLTGTIGTGKGTLSVTTHNGSVRIEKASG